MVGGLRFTDQQYAKRADFAAARLTTFTIRPRWRLNRQPSGADYDQCIIAKGAPNTTIKCNYYVGVRWLDGFTTRLLVQWADAGGVREISMEAAMRLGVWYAGAVTWDGTTLKTYIAAEGDTAYRMEATIPGGAIVPDDAGTDDIYIGACLSAASVLEQFAEISVSELVVQSNVLTEAELNASLNTRLVGNESGLALYYRCDDGPDATAGVLTDRKRGGGHDATLYNEPEWTDGPSDLSYPTGIYRGSLLGWLSERAAAISLTNASTAHPASALSCPRSDVPARTTTDTGTQRIVFDLLGRLPIGLVYILHNLTSEATIAVEWNDSDSWGAPAVSEVATYHPGRIIHIAARPYGYRYVSLAVLDANNPDGYLELKAFPFHCYEVQQPPADSYSQRDPSVLTFTAAGDLSSRSLSGGTDAGASFGALRTSHARRMREIAREVMSGRPVLWCPDPSRGLYHFTTYGIAEGGLEFGAYDPAHTRRNVSGLSVREDRP